MRCTVHEPDVASAAARQTFIPHACDKYGCVSSGGSYEAHNVVEEVCFALSATAIFYAVFSGPDRPFWCHAFDTKCPILTHMRDVWD